MLSGRLRHSSIGAQEEWRARPVAEQKEVFWKTLYIPNISLTTNSSMGTNILPELPKKMQEAPRYM